jgi:hypothetical protein
MSGSEWTGMSHIPPARYSCCRGVTSVSELRNSFDFTFRKEGRMKNRVFTTLLLLGCIFVVPRLEAQIKHIEMRVEGMT